MSSPVKSTFVAAVTAATLFLPTPASTAIAASAADDPTPDAVTLLPPLPVRLGEGQPCTAASDKRADSSSWARAVLGLPKAQQLTRGAGTTVAVVGTGVSAQAPSLSGRVTAVDGADQDCVGHGTFAAGLIAGARIEGSAVLGIAPETRILALLGTDNRGVPSAQRIAQGIRTAADRGVDVIYVGHALRGDGTEVSAAVAYATGRGALVVAPAAPDAVPREELGPDGTPPPGPFWPAASPGALAVVDFGSNGNRQEDAPPAYKPDLAAPGSQMVSVGPSGNGHYIGSGASLAAAEVAGAAALVKARHPGATGADLRRRLIEAAYPADTPRLDPFAALSLELPAKTEAERQAPPAARYPAPAPTGHVTRSLVIAASVLALVLLIGFAAVIIPLGRARGWLPPGTHQRDPAADS
ncbi:S8 family serine peptidase [Streptomyces sp. NBC_01233]|uniref:S8 family serine peptidase n=1 Tax=Streptomyces sp. NBC_01233 TaxID=2903787 RepID=UPI002E13F774|nr:S8 family serine peptidase [Streptomyces sp. NBC_01233]